MGLPATQPSPSNAPTVLHKPINRNPLAQVAGWGLLVLALLGTGWAVIDLFTHATSQTPLSLLSDVLFRLFPLAFAVLATLLITRLPTNGLGWLMALSVIGGLLTNLTGAYLTNTPAPTGPLSPLLFAVLWLDNTAWVLFVFPILLLPLVFPTGRPPTQRWNWVVIFAALLAVILFVLATLTNQIGPSSDSWTVPNPLGVIPQATLNEVVLPFWIVALISLTLLCLVALVLRYRRGASLERAQIKWVVYACALFGVTYVASLPVSNDATGLLANLLNLIFGLSLFTIPLAIGIAILHYRLWDIDFVINRSLVYGALTVLLLILFGLSLFIVNLIFQNHVGGPLVAVAIAAAIFGAIFHPLRRRLQRFVDRRFYNIQIDYNQTPARPVIASNTAIFKNTQFGDYQNLELIGRGGMAEVYKSIHPTLGVPVAIKILPADLATDPSFRQRFIREAQTVAALQHPHIIRVFDHGEFNGTYYIVMEYIPGKDLSGYLDALGHLSLADALPILKSLADALDYAHTQGLVHRDIKPSNILLDSTPVPFGASSLAAQRPVLSDFGIAKILNAVTRFTTTGAMVGTLDYIAPEQIQGATDVDGRADVYAFGVMVYQLLTGVLPFQHQNPGALIMAHLLQPPPNAHDLAPQIPAHTAAAIQQAMAKKPDERFTTVTDFVSALA